MNKQEKLKVIEKTGAALDKQFDQKGTFQSWGSKVGLILPSISTGLPSIDWEVFGCGGFARGRIFELYGLESCGKTAFACHVIGLCQQSGGIAAFVDAEHAFNTTFAAILGVNMAELVVSQPDYGEQALETVIALVESSAVDLVVIDSVTALVPKAELEGEMGESHMGLQARLMSQAMRKLAGIVSKHDTTIIFINQIRQKVGLVFGSPNVTTGGLGLKFAASTRLELFRVSNTDKGPIMENGVLVGHKIRVKAQKNKLGPPFRETVITLYYDTGFDMRDDVIVHASKLKILTGTIKFVFEDKKYDRDELPLDAVRDAIRKYYETKSVALVTADTEIPNVG
jgi:recombination protein RecA